MNQFKIKVISAFFMVCLIFSGSAYSKEFLNTVVDFNVGIIFGAPFGNIINYETSSYSVVQPSGNVTMRPSTSDASFGFFVDITPFPPLILGLESNAIKFGLRAGFRFNYWQQSLTVTELNINYRGQLFEFKNWMAGLVIMYAPFLGINRKGEFTASGGFNFFVLFGTILDGKLNSYPVKRLAGESTGPWETTVEGYKIDAGIGGEISVFSINVGVNVFYSYLNLTMVDLVPYSGMGKITEIHEVCVEIYMGIPIEW